MPNQKYLPIIILILIILLFIIGIIYYFISHNPKTSQPKETPVVLPTIQNKITCTPTDMKCILDNIINNFKDNCKPLELTITPAEGSKSKPVVISIYGYINNKCYYQTKGTDPELSCVLKKDYVTETTIRGLLGATSIANSDSFKKIKSESCR
jgi:hypothetical protein